MFKSLSEVTYKVSGSHNSVTRCCVCFFHSCLCSPFPYTIFKFCVVPNNSQSRGSAVDVVIRLRTGRLNNSSRGPYLVRSIQPWI
jgi:hypothetical protein